MNRRAATRKQGPTGSYATVKQVPSAATRDFAGRTRKTMASARHAARTPPECPVAWGDEPHRGTFDISLQETG
jgi:hypothetical protein